MNCSISYGTCEGRSFYTKEEQIEALKKYRDLLEQEAKGVSERIVELETN